MSKSAAVMSLEERAISLLSTGIPAVKVAEICDVDPSRISQLMEEQNFKDRLNEAKFDQATKYNTIDAKIDELESTLVDKMAGAIGLVMDPMKLARMFQVVNGAKRRGTSVLGNDLQTGQMVQLNIPVKVTNKFVLNQMNQVVIAGGEDLITIQPSAAMELLNEHTKQLGGSPNSTETKKLPVRQGNCGPESV